MPVQAFFQTLVCGVTGATATAVQFPAGSRNVTVYVGTMASGTDIRFYTSYDGTTYRNLKFPVLSGTVAPGNVTIGSAATLAAIPVRELAGANYVKAEIASAVTSADLLFVYQVEY